MKDDIRDDILSDGFKAETIACLPDYEGEVVATLVSRPCARNQHKAVLYGHGYTDYFFQKHLADFYNEIGFNFYAIDFRKCGRSLRPHQTPHYCASVSEYFEELRRATEIIVQRDRNEKFLLNGHSTGGLIMALYADSVSHLSDISICFFNSPFLDFNYSRFAKKVLLGLVGGQGSYKGLGYYVPRLAIPGGLSSAYAESIHKDYHGEWDFNTVWKPIKGFPPRTGWIRSIWQAQKKLQAGLNIQVPILVMHSNRSTRTKNWEKVCQYTDCVLNIHDIERYANKLGPNVTRITISNAMHDLILSKSDVRKTAFKELKSWLSCIVNAFA